MKTINVVAAVIERGGKYFATQRGYGEFKDWWEPLRTDEYTGKRFVFFSDPDGLPVELYER